MHVKVFGNTESHYANVHNVALRGHVMHVSYLMADTQHCQQMGVGTR